MRMTLTALAFLTLAVGAQARPLEPVDGSITYRTPEVRMGFSRVPAGSTFEHHFYDGSGNHIVETYRVRPDGTLEIIDRLNRQHG
ncbi:hypothetical protein EPK99_07325 [Neorhizobium lilium]|uniref:Uncharacterized protein n=1 Tax=Neorhizobium lilium TaxID=2503024 RepID=A0A444LH90_9HYPH|nr:hypothetical protein [Neorhizobium lilium]RWX78422.1 hypothetical protein EPK99_07325 [Neorhizobium lilium]